jgi:hypothetical protein
MKCEIRSEEKPGEVLVGEGKDQVEGQHAKGKGQYGRRDEDETKWDKEEEPGALRHALTARNIGEREREAREKGHEGKKKR